MSPFDRIANAIAPAYGHAQSDAYWLVILLVCVAGFAGLLYGRRFFWIFAGLLGFVVGQFASGFLVAPLPFVDYLIELAIGAAFGLLAIGFPWTVAVVIVFLGGGVAMGELVHTLHGGQWLYWLMALVAGGLSVLALRSAYDETMIALTAFYSALLLVFVLREVAPSLALNLALPVLAALLVIGIFKQAHDLRRERNQPYHVPVSAGGVAPDKLP